MRLRFRFLHQAGGRYYWESQRVPGDSRVVLISCPVEWFWGREAVFDAGK
jgi:hypothetical protein